MRHPPISNDGGELGSIAAPNGLCPADPDHELRVLCRDTRLGRRQDRAGYGRIGSAQGPPGRADRGPGFSGIFRKSGLLICSERVRYRKMRAELCRLHCCDCEWPQTRWERPMKNIQQIESQIQKKKTALADERESVEDLETLIGQRIEAELWGLSKKELEKEAWDSFYILEKNKDCLEEEPIVSHRKFSGAVIVLYKRVLRALLRPYTKTILARQGRVHPGPVRVPRGE